MNRRLPSFLRDGDMEVTEKRFMTSSFVNLFNQKSMIRQE